MEKDEQKIKNQKRIPVIRDALHVLPIHIQNQISFLQPPCNINRIIIIPQGITACSEQNAAHTNSSSQPTVCGLKAVVPRAGQTAFKVCPYICFVSYCLLLSMSSQPLPRQPLLLFVSTLGSPKIGHQKYPLLLLLSLLLSILMMASECCSCMWQCPLMHFSHESVQFLFLQYQDMFLSHILQNLRREKKKLLVFYNPFYIVVP